MGMMNKIQDAQRKIEEVKSGFERIELSVQDPLGRITVGINANRVLTDLKLSPEAQTLEKEQLETLIKDTVNEAVQKAGGLNEEKLSEAAREHMPQFPGMDKFLK